jgi:transcription initiation factor TFIID subunit 2
MDSDFEWISEITLEQPDHMWAGQLEKDRDVVSQYEVFLIQINSTYLTFY